MRCIRPESIDSCPCKCYICLKELTHMGKWAFGAPAKQNKTAWREFRLYLFLPSLSSQGHVMLNQQWEVKSCLPLSSLLAFRKRSPAGSINHLETKSETQQKSFPGGSSCTPSPSVSHDASVPKTNPSKAYLDDFLYGQL